MSKPQIYAEVTPSPESGEDYARVVLKGMVFDLETLNMDMNQAKAVAAELNDRMEAGDLNELIKNGQADKMRDQVARRAVRYANVKASGRKRAGMSPLSTLAALMAGVGDLAVTASETALAARADGFDENLIEDACRGAAVTILETAILLSTWGIDARVVIKTFLDSMEERGGDEPSKVSYLRLVDREEN